MPQAAVYRENPSDDAIGTLLGGLRPSPEDKALSEMMISYWINFAVKGDPNGPGLPVCPVFDEKEQKTLFFEKTASAKQHPNLDKIKAWDAHFARERKKAIAQRETKPNP